MINNDPNKRVYPRVMSRGSDAGRGSVRSAKWNPVVSSENETEGWPLAVRQGGRTPSNTGIIRVLQAMLCSTHIL